MITTVGPSLKIAEEIHASKYRQPGETFDNSMERIANSLSDNQSHNSNLRNILVGQRFLPAGRIQAGAGTDKKTTLFNCFVSGDIKDDFVGPQGIMARATEAAQTMRMGGGVGYNFGTIRPRGDLIKTLNSQASGPVSFMEIFDAVCRTVSSSGHRRGAQMGVLPVSHPDIQEFVRSKRNTTKLTGFNISVGITDEFMRAVQFNELFSLRFGGGPSGQNNGRVYKQIQARELWDEIMRSTWDYAEPGVLFMDRINEFNNLWYCEDISSTNPCSEQPLPPHGACLLGSFNLVRYVKHDPETRGFTFDWTLFIMDIYHVVRAMDNAIDVSNYPLEEQKNEALAKRRMGLGITGFANAAEILGFVYGSDSAVNFLDAVCRVLRDHTYRASVQLAKEKGPFPLFDKEKYLQGKFIKTLPQDILQDISKYGIRNSHLTSIAPTGTISITADNVSSGIEPVFAHSYTRTIQGFDGPVNEEVTDFAYRLGVRGRTASECTIDEHLSALLVAQKYVDSAVSKTVNVGPDVTFEQFEDIYMKAYLGGAKGLSTFRVNGMRQGILQETPKDEEPTFCTIDAVTGNKTCG